MPGWSKLPVIQASGPVRLSSLIMAAAEAPIAGGRKGADYREIPCKSALNRCTSDRMPFDWTINPYRGCEFGCTYCYARYSHEYLGMEDWLDFQNKIFVKREAPSRLARELRRGGRGRGAIAPRAGTGAHPPPRRGFRVSRAV